MKESRLEQLKDFRQKNKFSAAEWEKRGLNPSDSDLCSHMEKLFNDCADSLIELVIQKKSKGLIKKELKNGLSRFNKLDYDTEEKEFICDYFFDLSQILEIDFKENLNKWLYGFGLNLFMKIIAAIRGPEKIIETLSQNCTSCNSKIETFVLQKQEDLTFSCYYVIKCKSCGEYNLLDRGPGIKQYRAGNYETIEQLSKDEYTYEQAIIRLEQIKYFRKQ